MAKYLKSNKINRRTPIQNRIAAKNSDANNLKKVQKRIFRQAALTVLTIILTVVILFAMTSAWYTNVVQTSGLSFEAEAWGFKGEITIPEEEIKAAPGDEGIVNLTVQNDSDSVSAISVNVYKNKMAEEMQKRLFFYVDTRMSRNEETMERVYLNKFEGYTYNVFNNSQLTLTEEFSNAPVIKWEWVYDVLGYYVIGKPYTATKTEEQMVLNENGELVPTEVTTVIQKMNIKEYLRPIVYDFDEATTVINTDGEQIEVELNTVDGVRSPLEFLEELSKSDGYKDVIDADDLVFGNYYKVDVDEEGYGVYAYLCNYSDIQKETDYDTNLGELAYKFENSEDLTQEEKENLKKELQHKVTLSLSAQKDDNTVLTVSTADALQQAINMGICNVVQLNSDVTVLTGQTIDIPKNTRIMLDLNGHIIKSQDGAAITANPGSSLTLTGGTLIQENQEGVTNPGTTYGVRAIGAEVVMSHMDIQGFVHGVYVGDNASGNDMDSRVHIMDTTIEVENCAAFISGNGLMSEQKSRLIIENSMLGSGNIVVAGNGDTSGNGRWGTDIQIINSQISGTDPDGDDETGAGIYHPQKNSTLTILDSRIEGSTGIVLKGGRAVIDNTTVNSNGKYQEPKVDGSGFTNTGDAVYIETSYSYDIELRITGNSCLEHGDPQSCSLRVYKETATNVQVEIKGGTFEEALPDAYLAEGYMQEENRNEQGSINSFTVKEKPVEETSGTETSGEETQNSETTGGTEQ